VVHWAEPAPVSWEEALAVPSAPAVPMPPLGLSLGVARSFASSGCWKVAPRAVAVDWAEPVHECSEELLALETGSSAQMTAVWRSIQLAQRFPPRGCSKVALEAPAVDLVALLLEYLEGELAVATDAVALVSELQLPVRIAQRYSSFGCSKVASGTPVAA
jgi:hypothetical protein